MRIRRILLVHPTRSIRALIKKYVFAELSDVEFVETENGESTLSELHMNPFDVIVSTADLSDMAVTDLKSQLGGTQHNAATPFIVLSEDEQGKDVASLQQSGFDHVVDLRMRPTHLIQTINTACNPRNWRKDQRYYIPGAKIFLQVSHVALETSLINISRGGVLVDLLTHEPQILMEPDLHLTVRIPGPSGDYDIESLPGMLSRVSVIEWHPDHKPAAMRATFIFHDLAQTHHDQIEQVLQLALEDDLEKTDTD